MAKAKRAKRKAPKLGHTYYSGTVKGTSRNHDLSVSFDYSEGYVGINQGQGRGDVKDRVLLSPGQIRALYRFIADPVAATE